MSNWFYLELFTETPFSEKLKTYVPDYITNNSLIFDNIYNAQGSEFDSFYTLSNTLLNQFFVETATWGLKYWEDFLAIPTDENKSYEVRRSNVINKIRANETITKNLVKTIAENYGATNVQIAENSSAYNFQIKFVDSQNLELKDMQAAIEELKPAHLRALYTKITELLTGIRINASITVEVHQYPVCRNDLLCSETLII